MGTPGVFKLNIALPSGGAVTLECDDRELVRELLYSALPQLSAIPGPAHNGEGLPLPPPSAAPPAYNGNGPAASNGNGSANGNGAYHEPMPPAAPPAEYPPGAAYPQPPAYLPPAYPEAANGRETVPGYGPAPVPAAPAYNPPSVPFAEAPAPAMPATPMPASVGVSIGNGNGNGASNGNGNGHGHTHPYPANGNGNGYPANGYGNGNGNGNGHSPNGHAYNGSPPPAMPIPTPDAAPTPAVEPATLDENDYVAFCHQVSPLGDMRRVVVAAEAADRYLGIASVDPDELTRLFRLAGWTLPHNFVQTLRNAARSKFRWLERIAGQSGHYRVTDTGRSIVLGDAKGAAGMTAPLSVPAPAPTLSVPSETPAGAGIAG